MAEEPVFNEIERRIYFSDVIKEDMRGKSYLVFATSFNKQTKEFCRYHWHNEEVSSRGDFGNAIERFENSPDTGSFRWNHDFRIFVAFENIDYNKVKNFLHSNYENNSSDDLVNMLVKDNKHSSFVRHC